jgi:glutamine amidotransferase
MSETPEIALIDYGMGNLASVAKGLQRAGAAVRLSDSPEVVRRAGALVLPGVGAFGAAMARLRESGLADAVLDRVAAGVPLLGVCLGLQVLFEGSAEGGEHEGLSVLTGTVERIRPDDAALKVPHMGWNEVRWVGEGRAMGAGLPDPAHLYFVHSYVARPRDPRDVAGVTDYGGELVAAVARDAVWAVQFHPEKSSSTGLRLLSNFVALVRKERAP